jgi:hypothetical protein
MTGRILRVAATARVADAEAAARVIARVADALAEPYGEPRWDAALGYRWEFANYRITAGARREDGDIAAVVLLSITGEQPSSPRQTRVAGLFDLHQWRCPGGLLG